MGQFEREHISIQLKVPRGIMQDVKPREAFAEVFAYFAALVAEYGEDVIKLGENRYATAYKMINAMEARR